MFELRLRLQTFPGNSDAAASYAERLFEVLESVGLAEDVSTPEPDGSFNLWLVVPGDEPMSALSSALTSVAAVETHEFGRPAPSTLLGVELEAVRAPLGSSPELIVAAG